MLTTVVGIFMAVVTMFAIIANSLVFMVVCWNLSIKKPLNLFLFNLALADIGVSCTCIPYAVGQIAFKSQGLTPTFCTVNSLVTTLFVGSSALIIAVFHFYQYLMVSGPLDSNVSSLQSCVSLIIAWMVAISLAIGPLFGWGKYEFSSTIFGCAFPQNIGTVERLVYNGTLLTVLYALPFLWIGFCCIAINIHIRDPEVRAAKGHVLASEMVGNKSLETGKSSGRSAIILAFAAFVVFRAPFFISILLNTFKLVGQTWLTMADQIAFWAVYFHAASDPFLYALQHGEYTSTLGVIKGTTKERFLDCCFCCTGNVEEGEKPGPSKPPLDRIEEE